MVTESVANFSGAPRSFPSAPWGADLLFLFSLGFARSLGFPAAHGLPWWPSSPGLVVAHSRVFHVGLGFAARWRSPSLPIGWRANANNQLGADVPEDR
jgi:hypothetical protein